MHYSLVRKEIAENKESARVLAHHPHGSLTYRTSAANHAHSRPRSCGGWAAQDLADTTEDLLSVTREFLNPDVSRS